MATPTPVSLLIDFDGTISLQDVGDALLRDLVADQAAVRHMDQLYHEGRKGSRELTAWDMDVLPRDPAALYAVVDALPLDDSFVDLVRVVQESGAAIEVVSDGVGFHVERMLARLGLHDLPVATNAAMLGRGGDGVTFPYGHPACLVCGTCKRERIRAHQAAGRAVVFVGDGPSDRYAAHHADVIFAKWSLADWCREQGIAYEPWERLAGRRLVVRGRARRRPTASRCRRLRRLGQQRTPRGTDLHLWTGGLGRGPHHGGRRRVARNKGTLTRESGANGPCQVRGLALWMGSTAPCSGTSPSST